MLMKLVVTPIRPYNSPIYSKGKNMDSKPKTSNRSSSSDNFLADIARPQKHRLSYGDGFRLGIGIITAHLLIGVIVGGLAWALIVAFKLHL